MTTRIATRGSALARAQAEWVGRRLGRPYELVVVSTAGDRARGPLPVAAGPDGAKGLFVREVEEALLDGRADVAVHSMKDLPTGERLGLALAAIPAREEPGDALCGRDGARLADLPAGARVGTGAPRRAVQLKLLRGDLAYVEIRGNVETRLAKVERGDVEAVVLALAGLRRLGLEARATDRLPVDRVLPAPGQGALAVQTRAGEEARATAIDDAAARAEVEAERAFLEALGGGCRVPVGALGRAAGDALRLDGMVAVEGGVSRCDVRGRRDEAAALGRLLATKVRGGAAA